MIVKIYHSQYVVSKKKHRIPYVVVFFVTLAQIKKIIKKQLLFTTAFN